MSHAFPRNFEEFRAAAATGNTVPLSRSVPADLLTPLAAYLRLAQPRDFSFLLESIEGGERVGRYSFMGAGPEAVVRGRGNRTHITHADGSETHAPIHAAAYLQQHFCEHVLPAQYRGLPFSGGAVGFLGYGAASWFEPAVRAVEHDADDAVFLLFRTVVAFDHVNQTAHIQTVVFVEQDARDAALERQYRAAIAELESVARKLEQSLPAQSTARSADRSANTVFDSNFARADFETAAAQIQQLIAAGECYQAVLSQRLSRPTTADAVGLYRALRRVNPSPYNYLLNLGDDALIGSSPEMLVRCTGRQLAYRPIAGTRRRGDTQAEDSLLAQELLADEKERAEHVMLVDLGRNDLGRIAEYGTVRVERFMEVEKFSHVQHLVTHLSATLRANLESFDALAACFPAGTVTGAPKIRAMQALASLEPAPRGTYSGAVLYADYAGNLDSCIAIRTIELHGGIASVQAGAGIVADSVPALEYEETLNKARAMQQAIVLAEAEVQP